MWHRIGLVIGCVNAILRSPYGRFVLRIVLLRVPYILGRKFSSSPRILHRPDLVGKLNYIPLSSLLGHLQVRTTIAMAIITGQDLPPGRAPLPNTKWEFAYLNRRNWWCSNTIYGILPLPSPSGFLSTLNFYHHRFSRNLIWRSLCRPTSPLYL